MRTGLAVFLLLAKAGQAEPAREVDLKAPDGTVCASLVSNLASSAWYEGLGLSIARRAAKLHKGAIRTFNAGPGPAVEIELPGPIVSEAREAPAERVELSGPVG